MQTLSALSNNVPVDIPLGTDPFTGQFGYGGIPTFYTSSIVGDPLGYQNVHISEYTAMTIPGVWRATDFLSSTLAGLPKAIMQKQGTALKALPKHPANWIINDEVNQLNVPAIFWGALYHHAVIWGNGYAYIDRAVDGAVQAMYNLPPDRVFPFRSNGQQWYAVDLAEPEYRPVKADVIFHIPGLGFDGQRG